MECSCVEGSRRRLRETRGMVLVFFFSSRRRHTICSRDWSSDVCSSDLLGDTLHHSSRLVVSSTNWSVILALSLLLLNSATAVARQSVSAKKRSEEHTSELQSRLHLVCRLLLEKKKNPLSGQFYDSSGIHDTANVCGL